MSIWTDLDFLAAGEGFEYTVNPLPKRELEARGGWTMRGRDDVALLDAELEAMPVLSERREELAEVFEDYAPAVAYFFARRGFGPEDCRDLTQETFLKAYRGLARFRKEAELRTWLLRIATNVWKNTLRSQQAEKRSAAKTVSLEEIGSLARPLARVAAPHREGRASSPLDRVIRGEEHRMLREAVDELPPKMRRCVLLRVDRGLKYREIATIMSVTVDTVKTQLHQARQRLRERLSDHFDVTGDDGEG